MLPAMLIIVRHGESVWNAKNLFTGWVDVPLSAVGEAEARAAGQLLKELPAPDEVHTSLLTRAIHTCNLALLEAGLSWLPVQRTWRLNERHYGGLAGKDKAQTTAEFGAAQVKLWRRSYDVPPPPQSLDDPGHASKDPRYALLPPEVLPASECLKDVVKRTLPYWEDAIVPSLRAGRRVLVVAHGNSLRALIKHLEGISDDEIAELNVPTGIPRVYEFDKQMKLSKPPRYLGDAAAAEAKAKAVAAQADAKK
jgi:2,3-bisphosphoglycerate-dependent phosphoglycerate mutase